MNIILLLTTLSPSTLQVRDIMNDKPCVNSSQLIVLTTITQVGVSTKPSLNQLTVCFNE